MPPKRIGLRPARGKPRQFPRIGLSHYLLGDGFKGGFALDAHAKSPADARKWWALAYRRHTWLETLIGQAPRAATLFVVCGTHCDGTTRRLFELGSSECYRLRVTEQR